MKKGLTMKRRQALTGILFISPWILGFLVFVTYPLYQTIFMSFYTVYFGSRSGWRYEWAGLENYRRILFEEVDFVIEAQDFFVTTLLYVPVIMTLSIIIAILLNQKIRGKSFFRLLFFLPIIILNGEFMKNMSENGGMSIQANQFILDILFTIIPSYDGVVLVVSIFELIIQLLWFSAVPILIFLAVLQKIDHSLYEAASIDGASPWTAFWKITLPMIYPFVSVSVVYVVVFLANFDTNPINNLILESKYDGSRRDGYASAMAVLYAFLQIVLIAILYYVTRSRNDRGWAR